MAHRPDQGSTNRARAALEDFKRENDSLYQELGEHPPLDRTEEAARSWVADGLVVPVAELAECWRCKRQSLEQACERGDLFRIPVGGRWYYPAVFKDLFAKDVTRVNRELAGADVISKLIFWTRNHGALGGRTIAEALSAGEVGRALNLARVRAKENGWLPADATV